MLFISLLCLHARRAVFISPQDHMVDMSHYAGKPLRPFANTVIISEPVMDYGEVCPACFFAAKVRTAHSTDSMAV